MSYAATAASSTIVMKKKVKFIYTEDIPSPNITTKTQEHTLVVNNLYNTSSEAQEQFRLCNKGLEALDTSGKIDNYVYVVQVDEADGFMVRFHHGNDMPMVFLILL